jgi:hypothetical protein
MSDEIPATVEISDTIDAKVFKFAVVGPNINDVPLLSYAITLSALLAGVAS